MKRFVLVVLALCVFASSKPLAREAGWIMASFSQDLRTCELQNEGMLVTVYIVHVFTDGSTDSKWRLDIGDAAWTHLGETANFPVEGTALTGATVSYGACHTDVVHLMSINFFSAGSAPCTFINTVASPNAASGFIEATNCSGVMKYPGGAEAIVNSDISCTSWCLDYNAPVESTTWGQVKALYR